MDIPVGRILWIDMGQDKWGRVLYMVVNPPIVCETCDSVIFEWRSSEDEVICPECKNVIEQREFFPCPVCGKYDYMTLRVINNNNWHYDSINGEVTEYNDKAGVVLNMCGSSVENDIRQGKIKLCSAKETIDRKRKLVWTSSDEYTEGEPIPQEIIDRFPYDSQI